MDGDLGVSPDRRKSSGGGDVLMPVVGGEYVDDPAWVGLLLATDVEFGIGLVAKFGGRYVALGVIVGREFILGFESPPPGRGGVCHPLPRIPLSTGGLGS
jgi:hypothetical protein